MTDDEIEGPEQFSAESRERLRTSAAALTAALERHTAALLEMDGGTSSLPALFALNDDIREVAADWDDAVFEHTGSFPVAIEHLEDEEVDADDEVEPDGADASLPVSVLSRWDLDITDAAALVRAARAAHRRMDPSESEADALAAIGEGHVGQALYALVHEHGEPWFELPGVGMVSGHRTYLRRAPGEPPLEALMLDHDQPPTAPDGQILFSESW
ncbi:hypothetical protein [uncultured Friedmanniella sp.]|uniref:hypothetical protein n=1 Tax=uncultured Friedmanniella sp. TaxID=335381 RepID=UPI0035CBD5E5